MVVTETKEIASIYREVLSYPVPTEAKSSQKNGKDILTVTSRWSQRDLEKMEKSVFERSHVVDLKAGKVISQTGPSEVKNEIWNKVSPSGLLRAVVRSGKDKKSEDKQYLEIFNESRKLKTIDILALEKHGKIIENDGQFGSFEWSSSEGHILYMAEKKKPKTCGFFDSKAFKDASVGDDIQRSHSDDVARGDEHLYEDNWGEQMTERVQPVICILDIEANVVSILENLPDDISPGQAIWAPDEAGVVVCGWVNSPYKLGLRYCCQRKSFLYYIDIQSGNVKTLSEEGRAVRFPHFSKDMKRLVYLDTAVGGPHNMCARLIKIDWATHTRTVVVPVVSNASEGAFPGIYTWLKQAGNVWFDDNVHLALETGWRSSSAVIIVNTDTGSLTRVKKDSEKGSMSLLCLSDNVLTLACSSPNQPHHLLIGRVPDPSDLSSVTWMYPDEAPTELDWLSWSVLQHKPSLDRVNPKFVNLAYESILCLPSQPPASQQLPPLIVFSHGGPNSVVDTSFLSMTAFFCRCGYAVVMVNYRGSLGFGQDSVLSLLGQIGTQDVRDVESAMVEVLAKGVVDGNQIFAFGGSHGGFLTTHLIGQYPDTFKAAATRNPVINLASMASTTDIRDWVFSQAGYDFDHKLLADEKFLVQLWKASPLSHVDQVKTPVLLMVGLDDKRVPPSQGMEYYRALKARGVPIRYQTYPGNNHAIVEVDAEADCMMNTVLWFNTYLAS